MGVGSGLGAQFGFSAAESPVGTAAKIRFSRSPSSWATSARSAAFSAARRSTSANNSR